VELEEESDMSSIEWSDYDSDEDVYTYNEVVPDEVCRLSSLQDSLSQSKTDLRVFGYSGGNHMGFQVTV
jgi:hypothetical protein